MTCDRNHDSRVKQYGLCTLCNGRELEFKDNPKVNFKDKPKNDKKK